MQKNYNGSILIWSMFLVMFISFSFIYISDGINKTIQKNENMYLFYSQNNLISSNFDKSQEKISRNNEKLSYYFDKIFTGTLYQDMEEKFVFSSNQTITLNIFTGGTLFYSNYSGSTVYSSGILIGFTGSDLNINSGTLFLKNLSGKTNYSIYFPYSYYVKFPYNYLIISKNIGGTVLEKTRILVK